MWIAVAALAALAACGDRSPPNLAEERIELRVVSLPNTIGAVRFPWYRADGEAILFSGQPENGERVELLSIREDGSDYRCLSCGVAPEVAEPLLKPLPFPDGRRVLLRVGEQNPVRAADHAVLECEPDVARCSVATLVPISIPPPGNAIVAQDQREFRISPDGEHVGFTQVRQSEAGEGVLTAVVATLERTDRSYALRDARVVSTRGELKGFTPDAQAVLVAAFSTSPYEAANPDVLRVSLADGEESRVTSYPDYDEPLELSPDGEWYVVGSGRTSGLFETVAQVKRPNAIGIGLEPLVAALFVNERESLIQPWLVRAGSESDGATGRQLNPHSAAEGYTGRAIANWHPDGTRIVFWEGQTNPNLPPTEGTRIVVARLTDRAPIGARERQSSPDPTWAPPLADFVPENPLHPLSRSGLRGGSMIVASGTSESGRSTIEVTYEGFSDDGEWIVDGFERAEYRGALAGESRYVAELELRGDHRGFLSADATISAAGITGAIDSEVDGKRLHLPKQRE